MSLGKDLLGVVGTLATNDVLRERLALAATQAESLEKEKAALEARVAELEEQLKATLQQLASARKAEEFVEHRGAMFKRSGGSYVKAVYCPKCRMSVGSMEGVTPYYCDPCKWMADFTGRELDGVMRELPA